MENKSKLDIAILGGSLNSAVGSAHIAALSLTSKFNIVTGCFSRNKSKNLETGIKYGIEFKRIYDTLEELISHEKNKIDAILILTPTNQHKDQLIICLNNNIPIICEKAMTTSLDEAEQVRKIQDLNNGFLVVIYNYLGYPMLRELKHLILNNKFGKINHIQIEMPQEGFKRLNANSEPIIPQDWRLQDQYIPTISLDLGVHLHMIVKYLTGEFVESVCGTQETFGNFNDIIDNVNCLIKYSNNMSCSMWYSKVALGKRNGMKINIFAEKLSAEWIQEAPEYLTISNQYGNVTKLDRASNDVSICNMSRYTRFKAGHPAGFIEAFANYYEDIAEALNDYKVTRNINLNNECFGVVESVEGLNFLESITKSSITKQWVKLNNR
jgi:predicted dehydrogenase